MTPPRAPRSSRFADEAVVSFGMPRLLELIADPTERMDLALDLAETVGEAGLQKLEGGLTDALTAVEMQGDGWRARWVIANQSGTRVVRAVTLEPTTADTPLGGVTTNLLRELSPQRALAAMMETMSPRGIEYMETGNRARIPRPDTETETDQAARGGRPRVSDSALAQVAEAYLSELQTGQSGITTRIRQTLGFEKDSTVRDRIRMCRERGWLSPTRQGRRGGEPGPALIAFRESAEEGR